jgi:hypothetical protein
VAAGLRAAMLERLVRTAPDKAALQHRLIAGVQIIDALREALEKAVTRARPVRKPPQPGPARRAEWLTPDRLCEQIRNIKSPREAGPLPPLERDFMCTTIDPSLNLGA